MFINIGLEELDLLSLFTLTFQFPLHEHFHWKFPTSVGVLGSVGILGLVHLKTFSTHPTIKTLQLHKVFHKRKFNAVRSSEDGSAYHLYNIKKDHIGK